MHSNPQVASPGHGEAPDETPSPPHGSGMGADQGMESPSGMEPQDPQSAIGSGNAGAGLEEVKSMPEILRPPNPQSPAESGDRLNAPGYSGIDRGESSASPEGSGDVRAVGASGGGGGEEGREVGL